MIQNQENSEDNQEKIDEEIEVIEKEINEKYDKTFSIDQLKKTFPKHVHKNITQKFVDDINNICKDDILRKNYHEQILTYTSVLNDHRFKLTDYVNATKYCMHKMMGSNNLSAYIKTFPDRYNRMKKVGKTDKDIRSFVTLYAKNMLVNKIMEKSLIPAYIFGQDLHARALVKVVDLMDNADSQMVQLKAAQEVLERTSMPDEYIIKSDVETQDGSSIIDEYMKAFNKIAVEQKKAILGGSNIAEVANFKIKEEAIDV